MTDSSRLLAEVRARLRAMLEAVADGEDIPPGQRLRSEGMLEALVLLGDCRIEELQQAMADAHVEVLGRSLEDDLGSDWRQNFPFPQIPFFMRRAPVHRGGSDGL